MRPRGGIFGKVTNPSTGSASAIWCLREAEQFKRLGTWPTVALLNKVSSASAAYSLRNLGGGYSGPVIKARKSDGALRDIYAQELLDNTFLNWLGGNSASVTTWYDQSGNSLHATQATLGNMPDIASSGSLLTLNGAPAIYWANSQNRFLATTASVSSSGVPWSFSFVGSGQYTGIYGKAWQSGYDNATSGQGFCPFPGGGYLDWSTNNTLFWGNGYGTSSYPRILTSQNIFSSNSAAQHDVFGCLGGSNTSLFADNTEASYYVRQTSSTPSASSYQLCIGNALANSTSSMNQQFCGYMQELVFWFSDQSGSRSIIRSDQKAYYSLS